MTADPGLDDIAAMQDQGDFKEFLRSRLGIAEAAPRAANLDEPAPTEPGRRPGAWPTGSRPPEPAAVGTPEEWQQAVDEYRAWNTCGQPRGDFPCDCGCTPGGSR